jgi:penicillin V acylase-like amidase (Ntn superfamily)
MCTITLWSDNDVAVVASRNMDWLEDMKSNMWVFPRGIARDGLADQNALKWTSRYGSIITSAYDIGTSDGMNEQGLAAHLLWLSASNYGIRDNSIPGLAISLWAQFFLDSFATVKEAVSFVQTHPFQILTAIVGTSRQIAACHLMIEDATGDAAIFEYPDGKPKIHHGRQYSVMANDPLFDQQLLRLKQYQGFGGDQPLPGTTESADRFVRAAYYLKHLPKPTNTREAIAGVLSVERNVAQPFGTPDPAHPDISATRWRTVCDLTDKVYYFESTTSPNIIWVKLDKLEFSKGAPIRKLDLINKPDRIGDVSDQFKAAQPFAWSQPIITTPKKS